MAKLPAYQWYSGDWLKDPAVRSCSYAARGLWKDMLDLMHESHRRGYLQLADSSPVTALHLARMTGGTTDEVTTLLQELENSGVFSRTESGVIYNRRMVRDEDKRFKCAAAGRRGGGNPTFKGQNKGDPKRSLEGEDEDGKETEVELPESLRTDDFRAAWFSWVQYRKEIRHALKPSTVEAQLGQLAPFGSDKAIAMIRQSVEKGWQGLFEVGGRTVTARGMQPKPKGKDAAEVLGKLDNVAAERSKRIAEQIRRGETPTI